MPHAAKSTAALRHCPALPSSEALCFVMHFHGRLQRLQMIISLRQFSANPAAWRTRHASFAAAQLQQPLSWSGHQQPRGAWRCYAAQQLQAVGYDAGAAGTGAAATTAPGGGRLIRPGEVHIWWLDPAKVSLDRCLCCLQHESACNKPARRPPATLFLHRLVASWSSVAVSC